jgi:hypothetical protein
MREAKKLITDVLALKGDREALIAHTSQLIAQRRVTAEAQEGMESLLTKTKPSWHRG